MKRSIGILVVCLLAACSHSNTELKQNLETQPRATGSDTPVASSLVTYYKGISSVSLPNGQVVGKSTMLVRRTLNPSASEIEEYVIEMSPQKKDDQQEFKVIMNVEGNSFKMKDSNGSFSGTGTLEGEPWKWTSWSSKSVLANKMIVESKDSLEGNKLVVTKTVKTPDGKVTVTMHETYSPITKDVFEKERKQALGDISK